MASLPRCDGTEGIVTPEAIPFADVDIRIMAVERRSVLPRQCLKDYWHALQPKQAAAHAPSR